MADEVRAAVYRAELDILGPRLALSTAPRSIAGLMNSSRYRLVQLLGQLKEQEFVSQDEYMSGEQAVSSADLCDRILRGLWRYDMDH